MKAKNGGIFRKTYKRYRIDFVSADPDGRHIRDGKYAHELLAALCSLASAHICFKLSYLDWRYRLERAAEQGYGNSTDLLQRKALSHIPSSIDTMQRQILTLIKTALDIDGAKKPAAKKMVDQKAYRRDALPHPSCDLFYASG